MRRYRKIVSAVLLAAALAIGIVLYTQSHVQAQERLVRNRVFEVTFTNLTSGQTFSPSIFATHDSSVRLWQLNTPAIFGLMRIAEEGNIGPASSALIVPNLRRQFGDAKTQLSVLPGQTRSVTISAASRFPLLSAAWMLVMTNDGFTGIDSLNLMGLRRPQTLDLFAYDAGTERNNERNPFLIAREGTDRDPEGSVITRHTGIRADGTTSDAPPEWRFDPNAPVARITIAPRT